MIPGLEYHEEPVTLHSGGKSHWLVRGDLIFADEQLREVILDYWIRELKLCERRAHIIGIPRGGMVWAQALAARLSLTWGEPDDVPYPAHQLWVVDDIVTTTASIMAVPNATHRIAVVDRGVSHKAGFYRVSAWATIPLPVLKGKP